jgi:hypothetical protein
MTKEEMEELISIVEDSLEGAEGELAELDYSGGQASLSFLFYRSTVVDKVKVRKNILKELKHEPA